MQESESNSKTAEQSWFVTGIFYGFIRSIQNAYNWLFPEEMVFSDDAAGKLMRRMLAEKSLFDTVSSSWVGLTFWNKVFAVFGITLAAALIGIALSAPVVCALSMFFVCIGTHVLFASHESHRRTTAKLMAEELIIVQGDLEAQRNLFKDASNTNAELASALKDQVKQMEEKTLSLQQEIDVLHHAGQELTEAVVDVTQTTDQLVEKEEQVFVALDETAVQIEKTNDALERMTQHLDGISETVVTFHDTVEETQKTQKKFAEAVGDFGFFVSTISQEMASQSVLSDELSAKIATTQNELDENERFIEQYKLSMGIA